MIAAAPASPSPAAARVAVSVAFFLTGGAALAYEIVWARWLELLLGTTTHAATAVLAAFMGGLALGSAVLGRLADRTEDRLRLYGWLEVAVGLYGLAFPWLLSSATGAYLALARWLGPESAYTFPLRFALSLGLVLVPTTLMGGTLPVLVRFLTFRPERVGRWVAWLYFLNSAGAAAGCLAAGFGSVGRYGLRFTSTMAVLVNLVVGLTAILLARRAASTRAADEEPAPADGPAAAPLPAGRVRLAAFLSGGAALAYEIGWFRLLALVLGSSTDAFTLMLATFIGGLAAGSLWAAARIDRWREPGAVLALVQATIGVTAAAALPASMLLPNLSLRLRALALGSYPLYQGMQAVMCALLMAAPTFLLGVSFPLLARLGAPAGDRGTLLGAAGPVGPGRPGGRRGSGLGARVGGVLAAATAGNIAGSLGAGLLGVPLLGVRGTIVLASLLSLGAAASAATRRRALVLGPALGAVLLLGVVAPGFDLARLTGAPFRVRDLGAEALRQFDRVNRDRQVLFLAEDAGATVSVEAFGDNRVLRINGKPDASLARKDMATQRLIAHYPLLLHPRPRDVMIVGLGCGVTAGAALRHPVESVTVAEISPGVVEAARWFADVNGRCWEDPRLRLRVEDARNVLLVEPRDYDVIVSEPSNFWMTGVASLFTREFHELARARLRPGGLFVQWLQAYEIDDADLRLVLRTVLSAFPHATVFQSAPGDLVIVAGREPIAWDFAAMRSRMELAGVGEDLEGIEVRDLYTLLANQMIPPEDLPRFAGAAPGAVLHEDDWPLLERRAPRAFFERARPRLPDPRYRTEAPGMAVRSFLDGRPPSAGESYGRALFLAGVGAASDEVVAELRAALSAEPGHRPAMRMIAATLSMRDEWPEAAAWMARAAAAGEPRAEDYRLLAGYRLEIARRDVSFGRPFDPAASLEAIDRCLALAPDDADCRRDREALLAEAAAGGGAGAGS
jgi:spermidine synthase